MTPPGKRAGNLAALVLAALTAASCARPPEDSAADFRWTVSAKAVTTGDVEQSLTTTGTVRAREHAKVLAEAGGRLQVVLNPATHRRYAIGDHVKRGELLAIVAADELRTSSRLEARKQALDVARAEHERNRRLREDGLVSETQIADFESKLANARAEYENALFLQSKARIVAPIDGYLTTITTAADGELIGERSTVAEVMRFEEVLVDLDVGAGDAAGVVPGLAVRIDAPTSSTTPADMAVITGTIERVAPAIDPVSRTFRVEVGVDNREHRLRPGMFVRADVVLDAHRGVLVVPTSSVLDREGNWVVFVVEGQRAVRRPIEIGLVSEELTEAKSGVRAGDLVVTSGQETLQDGTRVNVDE